MARRARMRLSLGPGCIERVFALLVAAVMGSVGAFLVILSIAVVRGEMLKGADDWIVTAVVMLMAIVPALYVLTPVTLVMLGKLTSGVWLRGTTLRVRFLFRTTSVDLATADIEHGPDGRTLIARDPVSGSTITVALRGPGSMRLPPAQLRAVADAICHGRGARAASTDDPLAVAEELRALARS